MNPLDCGWCPRKKRGKVYEIVLVGRKDISGVFLEGKVWETVQKTTVIS